MVSSLVCFFMVWFLLFCQKVSEVKYADRKEGYGGEDQGKECVGGGGVQCGALFHSFILVFFVLESRFFIIKLALHTRLKLVLSA